MYFVGRAHVAGGPRWSVNRLATELGLPGIAVAQMAATLERAGLLIVTDNDELVPARDIGRIGVYEILDIAATRQRPRRTRNLPIPRSTGCWPVSRMRAAIAAASSRYATWSIEAARRRCSSLPAIVISLTSTEPVRMPRARHSRRRAPRCAGTWASSCRQW